MHMMPIASAAVLFSSGHNASQWTEPVGLRDLTVYDVLGHDPEFASLSLPRTGSVDTQGAVFNLIADDLIARRAAWTVPRVGLRFAALASGFIPRLGLFIQQCMPRPELVKWAPPKVVMTPDLLDQDQLSCEFNFPLPPLIKMFGDMPAIDIDAFYYDGKAPTDPAVYQALPRTAAGGYNGVAVRGYAQVKSVDTGTRGWEEDNNRGKGMGDVIVVILFFWILIKIRYGRTCCFDELC